MAAASASNALENQAQNAARAAAAASFAFQQQVFSEANDAGQARAGALFSASEASSLGTRPASARDPAGTPADAQPHKRQRKGVTDDQIKALQEFKDLETRANFGIKPSTLTSIVGSRETSLSNIRTIAQAFLENIEDINSLIDRDKVLELRNLSSMLHGAGKGAAQALKGVVAGLSQRRAAVADIVGEGKPISFKDISTFLASGGKKAPGAMAQLLDVLKTHEAQIPELFGPGKPFKKLRELTASWSGRDPTDAAPERINIVLSSPHLLNLMQQGKTTLTPEDHTTISRELAPLEDPANPPVMMEVDKYITDFLENITEGTGFDLEDPFADLFGVSMNHGLSGEDTGPAEGTRPASVSQSGQDDDLAAAIQASRASLPEEYRAAQPTEAQTSQLPEGYVWQDMPRDGNCFYHALARGIGRPDDQATLRQETANYASHTQADTFAPVGQTIEQMRATRNPASANMDTVNAIARPSNYTGLAAAGPELAAHAQGVRVLVINESGAGTGLNHNVGNDQAPDVILALSRDHFFLAVPQNQQAQAQPQGDDAAELADFLAEMLDEDMTQPQAQSQVDNRSLQELLLGGETDDAIDRM